MKKITEIRQIHFSKNHESRLLFIAIAVLMAEVYRHETPEEVIDILEEKAEKIFDEAEG